MTDSDGLTLYDYTDSGNGYKVRLALGHLGLAYTYKNVDILAGESRTAEFLALNPNGRIPVLQLADGTCLAESNAIVWYLTENTHLAPKDRLGRARVLQWMFFEQYNHEPNIATSRFILRHTKVDGERQRALDQKRPLGYAALDVMEQHLQDNEYFVGEFGIADIALYAYTHVANQGGFELDRYAAIGAWLNRISSLTNHCELTMAH